MKKNIFRKCAVIAALCFACQSFGVGYVIRDPFNYHAAAYFVMLSNGWGILTLFLEQKVFYYYVQGTAMPTTFFPSIIELVIGGNTYYPDVLEYFSP